jgi:hypothetical protein
VVRTPWVTVALLVILWLFGGDAAAQEATTAPPQIDGTGLDLLGWAVEKFGYPGIAVYVAWQLRGYLAAAKDWQGVPVHLPGPIVVQVHPDSIAKFVPRPRERKPDPIPDPPSENSDPPAPAPRKKW